METQYKVIFQNSKQMEKLPSGCADLFVTLPPYPMIEMWDLIFSDLNPSIKDALNRSAGMEAYEMMH